LTNHRANVTVEVPTALQSRHGWLRGQVRTVANSIVKQLKLDIANPPAGSPRRVLPFKPNSQAAATAQITASYPTPQEAAYWSGQGNLDTFATAVDDLLVKSLDDPGGGTNICKHKVEIVEGPGGGLTIQYWALICNGPCSDPQSACTWQQTNPP
jgi:hypothetical protein